MLEVELRDEKPGWIDKFDLKFIVTSERLPLVRSPEDQAPQLEFSAIFGSVRLHAFVCAGIRVAESVKSLDKGGRMEPFEWKRGHHWNRVGTVQWR